MVLTTFKVPATIQKKSPCSLMNSLYFFTSASLPILTSVHFLSTVLPSLGTLYKWNHLCLASLIHNTVYKAHAYELIAHIISWPFPYHSLVNINSAVINTHAYLFMFSFLLSIPRRENSGFTDLSMTNFERNCWIDFHIDFAGAEPFYAPTSNV